MSILESISTFYMINIKFFEQIIMDFASWISISYLGCKVCKTSMAVPGIKNQKTNVKKAIFSIILKIKYH